MYNMTSQPGSNSTGISNNNNNQQQQQYSVPANGGGQHQTQISYGGQQQPAFFTQHPWMSTMNFGQNQPTPPIQPPMATSNLLKRQIASSEYNNTEDKENSGPNKRSRAAFLESPEDQPPPMPDGPEEERLARERDQQKRQEEDEADDEVDDEEEDTSRSTKTGSSSAEDSASNGIDQGLQRALQQQQQCQQNPILAQHLYSTPQQVATQNYHAAAAAGKNFAHLGMLPTTPLAHSTPMLSNAYANTMNAASQFRNIQQLYWGGPAGMMAVAGVASQFPPLGGGHYGIPVTGENNNTTSSSSASTTAIGHFHQQQTYGAAAQAHSQQQQHPQQHLLGSYGISPAHGWNALSSSDPAASRPISHNPAAVALFPPQNVAGVQISPHSLSMNSTVISSIGHDSGVSTEQGGADRRGANKNESSSGGSSEESSLGGQNLSGSSGNKEAALLNEPKFPPYMHKIKLHGQWQYANLEDLLFDKPVPARLSLLNNNKKYQVSLAEIHRRLNVPECLNTSYLSGILRRAKNKDGGNLLRDQLRKYECGVDLTTGKRKSSQVTAFSTLCEREAVQLANDFGKIISDPQNGFPHAQVAMEMNRRSMLMNTSPEQRKQRMEDVKSTMEILMEAIGIVQQGIEKETLQMATTAELVPAEPPVGELMPQTLDKFKRFARLSHCYGNRAVLLCWQSLLSVFGHLEQLQGGGGFLPIEFGGLAGSSAGPSMEASAQLLLNKVLKQDRHA